MGPLENDDELTQDEIDQLMGLRAPQNNIMMGASQATVIPKTTNESLTGKNAASVNDSTYDINPTIRDYLIRSLKSQTRTPQPDLSSSAMLRGIAGGAAQIGTVHGGTPSAQPFIESSREIDRAMLAQAPKPQTFDPRVLQYLQKQQPAQKAPQYRKIGQTQDGRFIYADEQGREIVGSNRGYLKPEKPAQEPKNIFEQKREETAAKSYDEEKELMIDNKISIDNLNNIKNMIGQLEEPSTMGKMARSVVGKGSAQATFYPKEAEIQMLLNDEILKLAERLKGTTSDKDIEFLKSTTFDPMQSKEVNQKILQNKIDKLNQIQKNLQEKHSYIEKTGTIRGFKPGQMPAGESKKFNWESP